MGRFRSLAEAVSPKTSSRSFNRQRSYQRHARAKVERGMKRNLRYREFGCANCHIDLALIMYLVDAFLS